MTETKGDKKEQKMERSSHDRQRTHHGGNPKYTVGELLLLAGHTLWQQLSLMIMKFVRDLNLNERIESFDQFLRLHPFMVLCISSLVLVFGLPFIIFSVLALTTVLLTFMGIVIVEGTVITITSIVFFGFVGCIVMILLILGGTVAAGYFGLNQIFDLFNGNPYKHKETIMKFLRKAEEAEPKLD